MAIYVSKKNRYAGGLPAFYVGRPSPLGNPFRADIHGLDKCLELFEDHLVNHQTHAMRKQ